MRKKWYEFYSISRGKPDKKEGKSVFRKRRYHEQRQGGVTVKLHSRTHSLAWSLCAEGAGGKRWWEEHDEDVETLRKFLEDKKKPWDMF